jgi:carboxyl-terminal processing protease
VLAGALRDHQRALVMGTPTFGKGSVQTVLPMDNGDSIKVTTARYYTPNGTSIQAAGIVPDIELLENASLKTEEVQGPTIREANLPGHLRAETLPVEADDKATLADDYAVGEALNLLRGLAVFRDRD